MILACPKCGSVKWTITAEFEVGWTIPTTRVSAVLATSMEHPEQERKCTGCGAAFPTFEELREMRENKQGPWAVKL